MFGANTNSNLPINQSKQLPTSKFLSVPHHIARSGAIINQSITITPIRSPNVMPTITSAPPPTSVSIIPVTTTMAALQTNINPIPSVTPMNIVQVTNVPPTATINRMPQTKFQATETRAKGRACAAAKAVSPRTPVATEARRSSSRSIKRKRFDDEIVEYSVNYTQLRDQHRGGRARIIAQTNTATTSTNTTLTTPVVTHVTGSPTKMSPPKSTAMTGHVYNQQTKSTPVPQMKSFTTTNVPSINILATSSVPSTPIVTAASNVAAATVTLAPPNVTFTTASLMPVVTAASTTASTTATTRALSAHITSSESKLPKISNATASLVAGNTHKLPQKLTTAKTTQRNVQPIRSIARHTLAVERRRNPRTNRRRRATSGRPSNQVAVRDLGRWKPVDDLTLITGVQQTQDLRVVHRACKFSCRFTLQEIQARWYSLLFEPAISRTAISALRNLHPEMIESTKHNALFSNREEEVLSYIKSTDNPDLEQFEEILRKNAGDFHSQRTAKTLQNHWQSMRQYYLLCDQTPLPLNNHDQAISFSDAEDQMVDAELNDQRDEALEIELALADRSQKRNIRILDTELNRWNVLIDSMTGTTSVPEFDSQTLAVLRGRLVRYLMRSKEITFGRDAKDQNIDVDLSLEGSAAKISRRQGTIKLRSNGDFFIANEGKRPIYINGVPLATGNKTRLANNFVVEVCGLRLVFLTNYELINAIRHESAKTTSPLN